MALVEAQEARQDRKRGAYKVRGWLRISVELVPRSEAQLLADADTVRSILPAANAFNIPDLIRLPLRSWQACRLTRPILAQSIPHIRAIDIPPGESVQIADEIEAAGLNEVLVIKGDPPSDLSHRTYPNTSETIIRRFKRYHPRLRVYAAFDPYRQGLRQELADVERKIAAGADGFFTQPLFDLRLLEILAESLRGHTVFWGITPVLSEGSRAYWETTNQIVFPRAFSPSMDWNRGFARDAISVIRALNANVYLMPIRVNLRNYLSGLA